MNRLTPDKRAQILHLLCEGMIRAITRITGASKNTVSKLLCDVGQACSNYQDTALRNLPCTRVQVDEIWSFTYAKQKNVPFCKSAPQRAGECWTWTAIDAQTKLIVSWFVGGRDAGSAKSFITDLASRLSHRIQLTSDGHRQYAEAVYGAFGDEVDYAQLVKLYGNERMPETAQGRYSPAECTGIKKTRMIGKPEDAHVSTSYIERANLTMRMHNRRFTRLTNAFSKKIENHCHAVSLHFMFYNFCRIHQTLRVTPAMAAGVTDKLWEIADIASLLDERDAAIATQKRGAYKKRIAA